MFNPSLQRTASPPAELYRYTGMKHVVCQSVFRLSTAAILLLVGLLLAGCATPAPVDPRTWREEVRLSDGAVVVVTRKYVAGEVWYNDRGNAFYRREQSLELPNGLLWETKLALATAITREPLLVDHDEKSWIIVARAATPQHEELVFMRSSGKQWVVVKPFEVPSRLPCNLATNGQRSQAEPEEFLPLVVKEKIAEQWAYRKDRPINPRAASLFCGREV